MTSRHEYVSGELGPCRSWQDQQTKLMESIQSLSSESPTPPRFLLAQFSEESITVYQAYKPSIGLRAAQQGSFADSEFSFSRMTWIKPNFSWMMYRCGWGKKSNQETVLAIQLKRSYFDELLAQAVPTTWDRELYDSAAEWHAALRASDVVVQWDPDHHLVTGSKLPYRVLQLGIRRAALEGFKGDGIHCITNITHHVHELETQLSSQPTTRQQSRDVATPLERPYPVSENSRRLQNLARIPTDG